MPGALHNFSRKIAFSVVAGQVLVACGLALIFGIAAGAGAAYSALAGALVGILPTYYLALRIFKRPASASPEKMLRGIYLGEVIKIVFTVALFVLAMLTLDVSLPIVFTAYLSTVVVNWVAIYRSNLGESPAPRG